MREYFAASRLDFGKWNSPRYYDEFRAALSLGELTDKEAELLREVFCSSTLDDVNIISELDPLPIFFRVKMLAKKFVYVVQKYYTDYEDYPPYFQPIKSAYESACMIQKPQRLTDFDTLLSIPISFPSFHIQQSQPVEVVIAGYTNEAIEQQQRPQMEWVDVSEAARRMKTNTEKLADARHRGKKQPDGELPGELNDGTKWRYADEKKSRTEYFLPTQNIR